MTPALALYFRKAYFLHEEKVPAQGPLVVIANHAASFLDAVLMGVMLKRPIHFFVRGDLFRKAWVRWVFRHLHMVPIYSADLAKEQLHRNADSFDVGADVLTSGGLLLIFPEGTSRLERNIMPLKKGVSRIIMRALELKQDLRIQVIPIGIHYTKHAFRADVEMVAGEVIDATACTAGLRDQPARAVNLLTAELERIFRKVVLFVDQEDRSLLMEMQMELMGNNRPAGNYTALDFRDQKMACLRISAMSQEEANTELHAHNGYFAMLQREGLQDSVISGRRKTWPAFLLAATFPIFALGLMLNVIPYLLGKRIADKKVYRRDFYTSVLVAASAGIFIIWLLGWLLVSSVTGSDLLLVLFAVSPLLAWFAVWWMDSYKEWKAANRLGNLPAARVETLRLQREALLAWVKLPESIGQKVGPS